MNPYHNLNTPKRPIRKTALFLGIKVRRNGLSKATRIHPLFRLNTIRSPADSLNPYERL